MNRVLLLLFAALVLAPSCQKVAGDGGNSSIQGAINLEYRLVVTNPQTVQNTVPAADEDVFIIYGEHTSPDDRIATNFNGEFEFRNLRPGTYTVYAYSADTTGNPNIHPRRMPILQQVEITKKKEVVILDTMTIYDKP